MLKTNNLDQTGSVALVAVVLVIGVIVAGWLVISGHSSKPTTVSSNTCVSKTFSSGASGQCVSDLQNMVNPQAYGIDGQLYIKISGTYGTPTIAAVKVFQKNMRLTQTGTVTPNDWQKLCHSDETTAAFVAAAKDAGCTQS